MITETSAVAFRQNLGEMLNLVQYRNDSILIKKDGKPVAALIDAQLFLRIRQMQERFDALCERLASSYDGVPEAVALAEIEEATTLARRETAAAWRAEGRLPALQTLATQMAPKAKVKPAQEAVNPRPAATAKAPAALQVKAPARAKTRTRA